jgi:hypothetical protein
VRILSRKTHAAAEARISCRLAGVKRDNVPEKARVKTSSTAIMTAILFSDCTGFRVNHHRIQTGTIRSAKIITVMIIDATMASLSLL